MGLTLDIEQQFRWREMGEHEFWLYILLREPLGYIESPLWENFLWHREWRNHLWKTASRL